MAAATALQERLTAEKEVVEARMTELQAKYAALSGLEAVLPEGELGQLEALPAAWEGFGRTSERAAAALDAAKDDLREGAARDIEAMAAEALEARQAFQSAAPYGVEASPCLSLCSICREHRAWLH